MWPPVSDQFGSGFEFGLISLPFGKGGQPQVFGLQGSVVFLVVGVRNDAFHRAKHLTLWFVEMADAFGAFGRIDHIDFRAHVDRSVRALRLANVAIDTFIGDVQGHGVVRVQALPASSVSGVVTGRRSGLISPVGSGSSPERTLSALLCSQRSTDGNTNLLTSPPSRAISRTMVPEMN